LFPIIFLDPWRIEPEVCHDLHPNAKLNINANNAAKIALKSISFYSPWRYRPYFSPTHHPYEGRQC
jgi:hypothetical protein